MNHILRRSIAAFAAIALVFGASALDLPIKKVKGKEYYYYKVKNKETVYGVSKHLGISREDIVRHNPSAADGLKKNMKLFFPVDEYAGHIAVADTDSITLDEGSNAFADSAVIAMPKNSSSILVMLPFETEADSPSRIGKFNQDFYRGFLLAADSLCKRTGKIEINVLDTGTGTDGIRNLTQTDAFRNASVIIGPEDEKSLDIIALAAREQGSYVLNVLNMRDTLYLSNPFALQANIPHTEMYSLAADAIEEDFPGYTPVILRGTSGRNEKEAFINFITQRYASKGIFPIEIEYGSSLLSSAMSILPLDNGQKYVVIPASGSLTEFNKFSHVLKAFRDQVRAISEEDPMAAVKPEIAVFGYPDWTAFRGDALDMLHKLEATIYSRFSEDVMDFEYRNIEADFRNWFGTTMMESVPTPALLGFDTGWYLIKNLRANDGAFSPTFPSEYRGIQSVFRFEKAGENGGYYNKALFIIQFLPGGRRSVRVI